MVERVRAAAKELGYRPNAAGRQLRLQRTHLIEFAVADIGNPVYVEMLSAIHGVLAPHGYRIVVSSIGDEAASAIRVLASLDDGHVDGIIISPLRVDAEFIELLRAAPLPVVAIGRSLRDHGIETVSTDSASGIGLAVTHLVDVGCRSLAFLNGPTDTTPGEHRQRGYDAAVAVPGFAAHSFGTEVADAFTVAAGLEATHRLLDRAGSDGVALDAVVAANDLLAIGAVRAARERGLSVPDDLAVTGMDDTELGRMVQPALTSVSLGTTRRGQLAAELMLARLGDSPETPHLATVGPELMVRESSVRSEA
ncbi:LacI family DNA-binding transcriptional regulator [Tessaracoccus coleopterorum]|uniref:LacI family DNA-binding transcriptional regulator n=1 Tax=Tessaracoccus coleopterorum TaxID=2714950 RepID=UPI0018D48017|nr:LacI family DNA-binding transcriptional regulator [Tessaracoccus coleopterorum]